MTNKEPAKYKIGQKIVVKSPITTHRFIKGRMYTATIIATPEESNCKGVAFSVDKFPSVSYAVLTKCAHIQYLDWKVVKEPTSVITRLVITLTNKYTKLRKFLYV